MVSTRRRFLRICLVILLAASTCVFSEDFASATVSTNVPLDDVAYVYLDKLIAQGLIKSDMWATRPFSRFEVARLTVEARASWDKLSKPERENLFLIGELLVWLEKMYREEIDDLKGSRKAVSTFVKPAERLTAQFRYQDKQYSVYNNEGLDFYDGGNALMDLTMRATVANHLGFFAEPRFVYYGNAENARDAKGNEVDEANFDFQKIYAKLDVKNIEIQFGADSLWWNPSYHGALLMSNNAEPFVMFKVSNPLPTVLPWILEYLGLFKFNVVFAKLDSNRLNPLYPDQYLNNNYNEPYFAGIHLDFKPAPWLEFGFNLNSIYGGDDIDLSFTEHLQAIFTNTNLTGDVSANSQFSMFWQFRFQDLLPISKTFSFYGEWGGEDKALPPDRRALQLGLLFGDFLKWQGRLQLQMEYTNTSPSSVPTAWYAHGEYPATYEGRVFGHHVGTDGEDVFASLSILINPQLTLRIQGDYEKRRTTLENGERVYQGQVEALYNVSDKLSILGGVGFEKVENADYVEGADENRSFFSLQFRYYF